MASLASSDSLSQDSSGNCLAHIRYRSASSTEAGMGSGGGDALTERFYRRHRDAVVPLAVRPSVPADMEFPGADQEADLHQPLITTWLHVAPASFDSKICVGPEAVTTRE